MGCGRLRPVPDSAGHAAHPEESVRSTPHPRTGCHDVWCFDLVSLELEFPFIGCVAAYFAISETVPFGSRRRERPGEQPAATHMMRIDLDAEYFHAFLASSCRDPIIYDFTPPRSFGPQFR